MTTPEIRWAGLASRVAALTVCGLLVSAVSARAVVVLGPTAGSAAPHVIVDGSGTGYTTWADAGSDEALHYCRMTIAPPTCGSPPPFGYPATTQSLDAGNTPVFTASGAVALLDSRCCLLSNQKFLYLSSDGGQSFGAPVEVAADAATGMSGNVLDIPAGALSPVSPEQLISTDNAADAGGGSVQATGLTASGIDPGFYQPPLMSSGTISESIARQGSTLVVVYTEESTPQYGVSWVEDSGGGNPNLASNWSAPQSLSPSPANDSNAQLADGPAGIFVARSVLKTGDDEAEELVVQRFTGTGWATPVTITSAEQGAFGITETPAGTVYVVWRGTDQHLHYAIAAEPAATSFEAAEPLDTGSTTVNFPAIAVDASGTGWVTWTDQTNEAYALPITPHPQTTVVKLSLGGKLSLATPSACVAPGAKFSASLALKPTKTKRRAFQLHLIRVAFSVARSTKKSVHNGGFHATLTLPGSARGSVVKVRATAFLAVGPRKVRAKTVTSALSICL